MSSNISIDDRIKNMMVKEEKRTVKVQEFNEAYYQGESTNDIRKGFLGTDKSGKAFTSDCYLNIGKAIDAGIIQLEKENPKVSGMDNRSAHGAVQALPRMGPKGKRGG
eukprot:comp135241_c0_seq1/m.49169 comp135241_c0_seq1/g.49169  ORF comp135241_c0_seq1/g.49169 comp135241_c0_seq1/m.49169 type:complete len:108 (-) comp135241_c0_seq1:49-372(-)